MPFPRPGPITIANANIVISGATGSTELPFGAAIGSSLCHADFNGDGLADIVISAYAGSPGGVTNAGEVLVVAGSATLPAAIALPAGAAVGIRGSMSAGYLGASLVFGGSMLSTTGDSIIVGENGATNAGSVYVFAGRAFTASPINLTPTDAAYTFHGGAAGNFQNNANAIGDVNGDGRPDLAIGAFAAGLPLVLLLGNAAGGFDTGASILSVQPNDYFGQGASRITDRRQLRQTLLFGSATAGDVVFGESLHNNGNPLLSAFAGRASWSGVLASGADATLTLPSTMISTGGSAITPVVWAGDLNGDGFPDLVAAQSPETKVVAVY
jgi:hypothetical protein